MSSAPALAQADEPTGSLSTVQAQEPVCSVLQSDLFGSAIGPAKAVVAHCGGYGLLLGHADAFEAYRNEALGAVLVDMRRGADRRVLLISLRGDGPPLLEDLSGQISMSAGRGPMSPLKGIEIDVAGFAGEGAISVLGRPEDNDGAEKVAAIDLGRQIAVVRAAEEAAAQE